MVSHEGGSAEQTYDDAVFTQDVTCVHLATTVVAAGLPPQGGGMGGVGLADGGYDAFTTLKQLADELQADASARTEDEPGRGIAICVEHVGDLVHDGGGVGGAGGGRGEVRTTVAGAWDGMGTYLGPGGSERGSELGWAGGRRRGRGRGRWSPASTQHLARARQQRLAIRIQMARRGCRAHSRFQGFARSPPASPEPLDRFLSRAV